MCVSGSDSCALLLLFVVVRQDRQRVYMVLEYADGGDALKHIQASGAITEERARMWTCQIASAVRYMHELDIAHRDLKLENLLIDASDNIKICDFGFVREATPGDLSQTYCGSKSYAAPEILQVSGTSWFLLCDATQSAVLPWQVVCPSVCDIEVLCRVI